MNRSKNFIFVLDDDPEILQAIVMTLLQENLEVMSFTKSSDCLKALHLHICHLLITDLKMPEIDGLEMIKKARALIPGLPAIVMTGFGNVRIAIQCVKSGAVDFLEKPLTRPALLKATETALRESHAPAIPLTKTELKITPLLLSGMHSSDIATELHRSIRTIEVHRSRILHKYGAKNITELILWTLPIRQNSAPVNAPTTKPTSYMNS